MKKPIYKKLRDVKVGETLIIDGVDYLFTGFQRERRVSGKITVHFFRGVEDPKSIRSFSLEKGTRNVEEVEAGRYKWIS